MARCQADYMLPCLFSNEWVTLDCDLETGHELGQMTGLHFDEFYQLWWRKHEDAAVPAPVLPEVPVKHLAASR